MNYDTKISSAADDELAYDPLTRDTAEDRRARRRMWLIAVAALVVIIGIWFVIHHRSAEQKLAEADAAGAAQAPVVTVITPGRSTIAGRINATGAIAAHRDLPIASVGEGGEVVSVLVDRGQWVKAGQPLAVINSTVQRQQSAGLAAQVKVAEANARLSQTNLQRSLRLVDRGFVSKADIDRLTAERDAAVAQVSVARAQFGESRARNNRLSIVAPAAGLVLDRMVEPGQVVSGGSGTLFRLAEGGRMEMVAKLSEDDLAAIAIGAGAQVTPVGSATAIAGLIWQKSPVVDPQTRLGEARIALPYSAALRPGGFATAVIDAGTMVAPRLPESAVLSDAKGSYVFVVDANDKVTRRSVATGSLTGEGIAITSGLTGAERVVLRAGAFLSDGETIKPRLVAK